MTSLFKYFRRREWLLLCASLAFIVAGVWLDLKMPDYMYTITGLVQTEGSAMSDIWLNGCWMLLCCLGSLATAFIVGFLAAQIGASFAKRIRSALFSKVISFSMGNINQFSTASLITRSTNDITQVQMIVTMGLTLLVRAPILAVWAVIKITGKGIEWTAATGIAVAILLAMFGIMLVFVLPKFKRMQILTDNINKVARENLTGLAVVRAYNAEKHQESKFDKANEELTRTHLFTSRAMAVVQPTLALIMNGLLLAVYLIGAVLINKADWGERLILFPNMIVFSAYSMQVIMAFMMISILFVILPRAQISAKRISEVLNTKPSINSGRKTSGQPDKAGTLQFRKVSFKFPQATKYVLQDVSFSVNRGETVAIIGSTGSGKSTLINLAMRFYDVTEGEVLIDGVDVRDYNSESLYQKIGYIPQRAIIFSGTVSSNVAFGQAETGEMIAHDIKSAVRIAQGADFVEKMDGAFDAQISRSGNNISGGQKQRLSIARAIYKKPTILLFDDSFSALDYKTDRALRTALKKELIGITSIIVAQRIGTIMDADKIVVLDNGGVVGIGKHKELLSSCKVYKEIAMSQLCEEELS